MVEKVLDVALTVAPVSAKVVLLSVTLPLIVRLVGTVTFTVTFTAGRAGGTVTEEGVTVTPLMPVTLTERLYVTLAGPVPVRALTTLSTAVSVLEITASLLSGRPPVATALTKASATTALNRKMMLVVVRVKFSGEGVMVPTLFTDTR